MVSPPTDLDTISYRDNNNLIARKTPKMSKTSQIRNQKQNVSTMKYLTMILALAPGVAAFSGVDLAVRKPMSSSAGRDSTRRQGRTHSFTRLNYISGAEYQPQEKQQQQDEGSVWWSSFFKGNANKDQQQEVVDDYIKFLDRRYHRLYYEDSTSNQGFSVMKWLHQGSSDPPNPDLEQKNEEDVLHVLGVAGLASQRLLSKHKHQAMAGLKPASDDANTPTKTEVSIAQDGEVLEKRTFSTSSAPAALKPAISLFRKVGARRQALIRSQTRQLRAAFLYLVRKVSRADPVKALMKFYELGGGKKSLALSVTVLTACSFLLRPMIKAIISESANYSVSS